MTKTNRPSVVFFIVITVAVIFSVYTIYERAFIKQDFEVIESQEEGSETE